MNTNDIVALRQLASKYCSAVDNGDAAGMAALFVPDGKLAVYPAGALPDDGTAPLREWQGAEAFGGLIAVLDQTYLRWVHFLGNHWAEVEGDEATGEAYLFACHLRRTSSGKEEEEVAIIRYRDVYRRTPGGWRFVKRRAYRQWTTVRPVDAAAHEIDVVLKQ